MFNYGVRHVTRTCTDEWRGDEEEEWSGSDWDENDELMFRLEL